VLDRARADIRVEGEKFKPCYYGGLLEIQDADRMNPRRKKLQRLAMSFAELVRRLGPSDPEEPGESIERSKQEKPKRKRAASRNPKRKR